jgi:F-type H+-transporting ATPase subunit delta
MRARYTKPYVDALFEVAGSAEAVERLLPGFEDFAKTLRTSDELKRMLQDPGVERERKNALLRAIAARCGVDGLGTRFLTTLLGNGRLLSLGEVLGAVRDRLDKEKNVVEALVTSAAPLDGGAEGAIRSALEARTKKSVRLRNEVDPALLGGFVVKVASEVYDASLARRLERARRAFHTAEPPPADAGAR